MKSIIPGLKLYRSDRRNIIDIGPRKIMTKVNWSVLSNEWFYDEKNPDRIGDDCDAENWSELFRIHSEKFVYEETIQKIFKFLFNPTEGIKILGTLGFHKRFQNLLIDDEDVITEIFVHGKKQHDLIKKILETHCNGEVIIINGKYTSNAECENKVKAWKNKNKGSGKKLFIIADVMGTRSFSIKEIKNIVLMIDGSSANTLYQRISRGLTENEKFQTCHIVDFRLKNGSTFISSFLANHIISHAEKTGKTPQEIIESIDFEKFTICDYAYVDNNLDFFKTYTNEDVIALIKGSLISRALEACWQKNDFVKNILKIVKDENIDLELYKKETVKKIIGTIDNSDVHNTVRGDGNSTKKGGNKKSEENLEVKAVNYHIGILARIISIMKNKNLNDDSLLTLNFHDRYNYCHAKLEKTIRNQKISWKIMDELENQLANHFRAIIDNEMKS